MKWFLVVAWIFLLAGMAAAEANITLEIKLPKEVLLGQVYTSLFTVKNIDYKKGVDSYVNATVNFSVEREDGSIYVRSNFSKVVNSYTSANTGYLFMNELGRFGICGTGGSMNYSVCANFTVLDPLTLPCNVSIGVSLDRTIFSNNERVDFRNELYGDYNDRSYIIEYWIEDLLGNVEKKSVNTSNLNEKTFTPKTDELDRVYVVRNKLAFIGCNNSNSNVTGSAKFLVKNQDYTKESDAAVSGCEGFSERKKKAEIYSFYTRTKKYHQEINIFANVKSTGPALLLVRASGKEEWRKINSSEKVAFLVPAVQGVNYYELEAYVNDVMEDKESLVVFLESESATQTNSKIKSENSTELPSGTASAASFESSAGSADNFSVYNLSANVLGSGSADIASPKMSGRESVADSMADKIEEDVSAENSQTGMLVYESSGEQAKGYSKYFVLAIAGLGAWGLFVYNRK